MEKFQNYFKGKNYLSHKDILLLEKKYKIEFEKIKRKKYLLISFKKRKFYFLYKNIYHNKEKNNHIYIERKLLETKNFLNNIKGYSLDDNQRKCVLSEEDSLLVIAGAGSGKSLTIIAKVCYLLEYLGYKEKEILCISFTNASSKNLEDSIKKYYGYQIQVLTFHKLALKILENENFKIASPNLLEYVIEEFYHGLIFNFPNIITMVIHYFYPNKIGTKEEYQKLLTEKNFLMFQKKIAQFIHLFKSNKEKENLLYQYLKRVFSKQEYYFLIQVIIIWNLYKIELEASQEIDFDDMILKAIHFLKFKDIQLPYRYVIIDEYQDSSLLRCRLIQKIIKLTNAKIMSVGDDFQSIYRFSGCDLEIFLNFQNYFSHPEIRFITNTYRNSQELIDIAGNFIMKNKKQIPKILHSNKKLDKPIKIIYYENNKEILEKVLFYLEKIHREKILVLGRNRKDINFFLTSNIKWKETCYSFHNLTFQYMTVHQSKGLEEDVVILISLENSITGFPNKLENDPIFRLLDEKKEAYAYEEERRLFYVAITRTKNENYLLVPKKKESIFVKELIRDFPDKIEFLSIK